MARRSSHGPIPPPSRSAPRPGGLGSGGAGTTLTAGFARSPFGRILIAACRRGICHLSFVDRGADAAAWSALGSEWPEANPRRSDAAARRLAKRVFAPAGGKGRRAPPRVFLRGTAFQLRVWQALLRVERGTLVSYGQLAASLGQPSAARAVGAAVARNPVACLIPCHRVIRKTGSLGGYRWGAARKQALVRWESGGG